MEAKKGVDQAVCSEPLRRRAEPVKRVEMVGLRRLWNWWGRGGWLVGGFCLGGREGGVGVGTG